MLKKCAAIILLLGCVLMSACEKSTYTQLSAPKTGDPIAIIKTSMGDITVRLFPEHAPKTVENFTTHAKDGYYDGVIFHRVIEDFMIQGGDPTGTGSGGESIWGEPFEDEVVMELHNIRGALSMANAGRNTNGSQFFIVQKTDIGDTLKTEFNKSIKDTSYETTINAGYSAYRLADRIPVEFLKHYVKNGGTPHLDYPGINTGSKHTVFGQVIDGMDVVDKIAATETDENDKPLTDVVILSIEITEYSK